MLSKFVGVFRELASFDELLHTQVELILVERLQRNWLKVCSHKQGIFLVLHVLFPHT